MYDLERLFRVKFCFRAGLALTMRLSNNNYVKTNKDRHILCQQPKSSGWSLLSGILRFVRIFDRVLKKEDVQDWSRALTLVLNIFSWISKTIA